MPYHSSKAIANEFLIRRETQVWPAQMQIQKLAYIANGWNWAIFNERLIRDDAEAWDNGPVYRAIWDHVRDYGYSKTDCTLTDPMSGLSIREELTAGEGAIIDHVWAKYGQLSADKLSQMAHEPNTPWTEAYFERGRNAPLDQELIRRHYIQLGMAGRSG